MARSSNSGTGLRWTEEHSRRGYHWAHAATTGAIANLAAASTTQDALVLLDGQRLLVKDQPATQDNGLYKATNIAAGVCVLVRADEARDAECLYPGSVVFVAGGGTQAGYCFVMTSAIAPDAFVVGTSAQTWSQIRASYATTAGSALTADSAADLTLVPAEWDDLVVSATIGNPPGIVGPAVYDVTDSTIDFQDGSSQRFDATYQLPHGYQEGSSAKLHLHAKHSAAGAGNIRWSFSWRFIIDGQAHGAWTTETILIAAPGDTNEHYYILRTFSAAEMVAIKISDRIQTQITRTGGHADDTFVGDIKVSSFDLHIQKDTVGSETETAK